LILCFFIHRDVFYGMTNQPTPAKTIERKKREAAALKANMRRRKEQTKVENAKEPRESEK
jgi:hypothetical protein